MREKNRKELFLRQVEEIKKHCWIESEKMGYDVGIDWAAEDWICKYAEAFRRNINKCL